MEERVGDDGGGWMMMMMMMQYTTYHMGYDEDRLEDVENGVMENERGWRTDADDGWRDDEDEQAI